ncbi:MAG TPA: TIGR03960 family B12-binding radical SAM protein [Desulfotignum sp.]|nr:TIGR03960 family B12-binding radical SAM protein [Desulfotignum sp.]
MHRQNYQDILGLVQSPTRYAGNEINTIKKDLDQVDLTFALVFPDLYEIGTSHFGLQILYSILNREKNIAAERFFTPAPDLEALMALKNIPCLSMESRKPLAKFDIIGFSLLYELNFTNILTMLALSGIPFFARDRDQTFPLVIGGGPCAFNPEPLADFFDAFVIGDGEETVLAVSRAVIAFRQQGDGKKSTLLQMLSEIAGVYVPQFFTPFFDETGCQKLSCLREDYTRVKRAFVPKLTKDNFPMDPIVPFGKPVHDRLRLEIARGCTRGCRFCQAGMIYRPVRERSVPDLIQIAKTALASTGYADISLLSLSTGDYSRLPDLMQQLLTISRNQCNAISLPSIRAERLTPELMALIKTVRKTGFTIAPEAGTQRLRNIINKNLTEESIRDTVKNAFDLGWKHIKLYFMMGLPFEEAADIQGICDLSNSLASDYAKGKRSINVSVTTFIPKPHTPFQRHPQLTLDATMERLNFLKKHLGHPKVNLKWQDPCMSLVEGVFSRGDRKLSQVLAAAHANGCRLDGWNDYFDFSKWRKSFEQTGIDPDFYTSRHREKTEPLPWEHIDTGVSQPFLEKEWENAAKQALTPDCREQDCTGCGVCDFKQIRPVIYNIETGPVSGEPPAPLMEDAAFSQYTVWYAKLADARFFGHLELATIVQRAVRRASLAVKYSKGFNPSMRLSFDSALPVGMESEEEICHIFLDRKLAPETIQDALNRQLPPGLTVTDCRRTRQEKTNAAAACVYQVRLPETSLDADTVDRFMAKDAFVVEDLTKKGKIRKTDLRQSVAALHWKTPHTLEMTMQPYNGRHIRPGTILKQCFSLTDAAVCQARIKKRKQG